MTYSGISPLALAAVARITTNSRFYLPPSAADEASAFGDYLLDHPHCQVVEPGDRHWRLFKRLCSEADIRGSRMTDAWSPR